MEFLTTHSMRLLTNLQSIKKIFIHDIVFPWSIPLAAVVAWFFLTQEQNSQSLFPPPAEVVNVFLRLLQDGTLWENLSISTFRAIAGFVVGGSIGFVLGIINGQFKWAEEILNTPVQMVRNVPHLALLPLILIWFGIGETAKIILIALGTFFPIYLNTFHGIRYIDKNLLEMGKTYGLSRWAMFVDIILPGAMASIMIGLRQSLGRMWITLIVAETVAAKSGIGYMATNAREFMLMEVIVLSLVIYAILGSLSDFIAGLLEKRLLRWHANYRRR